MLCNKLGYTCIDNYLFELYKKSGRIIYLVWGIPICLSALYLALFSLYFAGFYLLLFSL